MLAYGLEGLRVPCMVDVIEYGFRIGQVMW